MKYLDGIWSFFAQTTCPPYSNILGIPGRPSTGLPNWYRGLQCDPSGGVMFSSLNDVWIIVANLMDITVRLAGVVAVFFIIYGGIRYIISQGEPEGIQAAKRILTYAVIGLVLAIMASTIVGLIAGLFG